ncbi:MAG: phosphatidylglycerophosphatase A [Planctomycetaceae bacterium]|nr:phosphatidylglycerophosphatase A [Planctomycetaceae bacterium]
MSTASQPLLDRLAVFIATGCGLGRIPFAPGTFGTLGGIPLAWAIGKLPGQAWQALAVLAVCAVGIPICTRAVRALGRGKDPGSIVWDEIASLPITYWGLPLDDGRVIVAGFVLHRLFDITKPPPARQLERLPDGLGIMADDWIAGLYSHVALRLIVLTGVLGA